MNNTRKKNIDIYIYIIQVTIHENIRALPMDFVFGSLKYIKTQFFYFTWWLLQCSSESSDIDELSTNDSDYHSTTESNYAIKINLQWFLLQNHQCSHHR